MLIKLPPSAPKVIQENLCPLKYLCPNWANPLKKPPSPVGSSKKGKRLRPSKKVPVLVGVAEYTTAQSCRWAADAAKLGADGLMVLPPMVYKSDDRETLAHFRTVAKATDLPIMIYNNPPAYKVDITPEMFVEMADEPKFACIKESSDNPRRVTDIINLTKDRYVIFAGVDDL
ncbi:MAG: dihydrodipicolinate synthase family protein, partial [Anaerolineae bacterium]|nr:dihydrodipicolinate synthase family protein [Anaerolineae bacterium]